MLDRPTDKLDTYIDLRDAVAALPGKQRRAALLYSMGYTQAEIAAEMEITQQAACNLLKKVISSLRGL